MAVKTEAPAATRMIGSSGHSWQDAASEWRANWRIGLAAFLALGFSHGSFQAVASLYVMPLQKEFGWSRAEIAYSHNSSLVLALCAPFVGRAIDRFGVRRIMLAGMTLSAMVYVGQSLMNGSLILFYTLAVLAGVVGLTGTGLTCSRVVSQAFVRSRGLSLAVARSGLALAGASLPFIIFTITTNFGWRAGYLTQTLLVIFVALPAVYFWVRPAPTHSEPSQSEHILPKWLHHLHDRRVWLMCLGAGLGYAPAFAVMSQLQPLLVGKGIVASQAAGLVGLTGAASFVGALVTGSLVDRFWAPAIAFLFACGSAVGACLLAMHGTLDGPVAILAVLLIGLGLGAEIDVVAYMVARYFGIPSFSTLYGLTVFFIAFFGALGTSMLGLAYDTFGNYDLGLYIIAASFVAAGCLYLLLGRYPPENLDRPSHSA